METTKLCRGNIVNLALATFYYTRSDAEMDQLYESDRINGRCIDEVGETRIYSRQGALLVENATVIVTSLQGCVWSGFGRKPKGLVKVIVTGGRYLGREMTITRKDLVLGIRIS